MYTTKEKLLMLLDILRDIRDCNKKYRKHEGICNMFNIIVVKYYRIPQKSKFFEIYSLNGVLRTLDIHWENYPNFSGEPYYPVKHPTNNNPMDAFNNCTNFWYGAYGKERYKLLDWLIAEVKVKLSNLP